MLEAGDWRDRILQEFTPKVAPITLAADPDGLLLEEALVEAIRRRGFELLPYEDPVAFRFAYESRFRCVRNQSDVADLVVVSRTDSDNLATVPFDILAAARRLSFGLRELFPDLSYPIIACLNQGHLDTLYRAQMRHRPGRLGDDATKDFVLLHVFQVAPAQIENPSDLLHVLLRRHYRGQTVPRPLEERLLAVLRHQEAFNSWPLETIVPDRNAFFSFLQERWPQFLDRSQRPDSSGLPDTTKEFDPQIGEPAVLPFDHDDVRVYIDNLFTEGMLHPVAHKSAQTLPGDWVAVGIKIDPEGDTRRRLEALLDGTGDAIPRPDARHFDWSAFAHRWSELHVLWSDTARTAGPYFEEFMSELRAEVDREFLAWVERRYAGLHNQPPDPPVMVHHVPRYLAGRISDDSGAKVALIVVDGLALDQWIVLRNVLATQRPCLRFREGAVFAWVPTITSVSRQSIFAGKPPLYFPASVHTTDKEAALWTQFWVDQGLTLRDAGYARGLGDGPSDRVLEDLPLTGFRALGLVVDKVDKIMHGMELGSAGMHNQVRQWVEEGFMAGLLDMLLHEGFSVFLTSDHGNIEANGRGRPSEGAVADVRGERARIYSNPMLRSRIHERFPDAIAWPPLGLPEDLLALLAPGRTAFVREGERIVGHGGVSLEEVVVPWVQIEQAEK
ncbi:MAG: BREX-3 system phosphatase PglZ [Gammaproteobacteria bacterium]|nr:BREX-3 system phosphatase PglZ [Gammaproteobacteria bacterium]